MTKYNTLNVKLYNSQFDKLKSGRTGVTLDLLSNSIGNSNFTHKFSLTDAQVLNNCKSFANGSPANFCQIVKVRGLLLGPHPNIFDSPILPIKGIMSLANSSKGSFKKII